MPSRGRLGRPRRKIGDQSRNGSGRQNRDDGNWFGGSTNWRNEMAYRYGNNSPPKPNTHIRFNDDSEESPTRNVLTHDLLFDIKNLLILDSLNFSFKNKGVNTL